MVFNDIKKKAIQNFTLLTASYFNGEDVGLPVLIPEGVQKSIAVANVAL
jgi:hypothetical protein